jgi:alpha-glucosidase
MGYRIGTDLRDSVHIAGEQAEFKISDDYSMWAAHSSSGTFEHSYESLYTCRSISALWDTIIALPALIDANNVKVLVTEAGIQEYPVFHLKKSGHEHGLMAVFAGYPLEVQPGGHNRFDLVVQQRADYIAKTAGTRDFPWRIIKIAASDLDLLDTDFSFLEAGRYRAVIL